MKTTRLAILSILLALPLIAAAQDQAAPASAAASASTATTAPVVTPGSVALIYEDATPKAAPDPARSALALKAMAADFQKIAKLVSLPQDSVDKTAKNLFFPRAFDASSAEDATTLGKKLRAQAVGSSSVSIINGIAVLTLRLFETETGKKVAEKTDSGPVEELPKLIDANMDALGSAWASRPKPLPPPPAAKASTAGVPSGVPVSSTGGVVTNPLYVSFLGGYETVFRTSLELEFARSSSALSIGIELAYGRLDPFAHAEDLTSLSAIGRWWPQNGKEKKGLFLALGAGLSNEYGYGIVAGPFSLAIGTVLELGVGTGEARLDRSLRFLPEIGFSWSSNPTTQGSGIVGFLPFAGIKTRY